MHFALQHGTEGRRRRKIQVPIGCVAAKNKQKTTAANPRLDSNSPRVPKSTARLSSGYTVSRSLDLQDSPTSPLQRRVAMAAVHWL